MRLQKIVVLRCITSRSNESLTVSVDRKYYNTSARVLICDLEAYSGTSIMRRLVIIDYNYTNILYNMCVIRTKTSIPWVIIIITCADDLPVPKDLLLCGPVSNNKYKNSCCLSSSTFKHFTKSAIFGPELRH